MSNRTVVRSQGSMNRLRSPVGSQTLCSLGGMLVEIANGSALQDIQPEEDDQGDLYTLLGSPSLGWSSVARDGVTVCGCCGNVPVWWVWRVESARFARVQEQFFDEVVRKLERCAEAVAI